MLIIAPSSYLILSCYCISTLTKMSTIRNAVKENAGMAIYENAYGIKKLYLFNIAFVITLIL